MNPMTPSVVQVSRVRQPSPQLLQLRGPGAAVSFAPLLRHSGKVRPIFARRRPVLPGSVPSFPQACEPVLRVVPKAGDQDVPDPPPTLDTGSTLVRPHLRRRRTRHGLLTRGSLLIGRRRWMMSLGVNNPL